MAHNASASDRTSRQARGALLSLAAMLQMDGKTEQATRLSRRAEFMALSAATDTAAAAAAQASEASDSSGLGAPRGDPAPARLSEGESGFVKLAELYASRGNYEEAIRLQRRVIEVEEQRSGANSPLLAPLLVSLATMLTDIGRTYEAQQVRQRAAMLMDLSFV